MVQLCDFKGNAQLPAKVSWRSWLEELSKGRIYPSSYKLVMVGAEGVGTVFLKVGKTTLVRALLKGDGVNCKVNNSTDGIEFSNQLWDRRSLLWKNPQKQLVDDLQPNIDDINFRSECFPLTHYSFRFRGTGNLLPNTRTLCYGTLGT